MQHFHAQNLLGYLQWAMSPCMGPHQLTYAEDVQREMQKTSMQVASTNMRMQVQMQAVQCKQRLSFFPPR